MLDKKGVGKRIAYYRKEHGMTQKDLAALLNIVNAPYPVPFLSFEKLR